MGVSHKDNWKRVTGVRPTAAKDPMDLMLIEDLIPGPGILITPGAFGVEWRVTGSVTGCCGPVGPVLLHSIAVFSDVVGGAVTGTLATIDTSGNMYTPGDVTASGDILSFGTVTASGFVGEWLGDTINVGKGGTGRTSLILGGLLVGAGGANPLTQLSPGASGDILTISGGVPIWQAPTSVAGASSGIVALSLTPIAATSGNITNADSLVLVSQSGATTLVLQGAFDEGRQIIVKDSFLGTTNRIVNTITITPQVGLIDGQANAEIVNANQSLTLAHSSGQWYII